MKKYLLTLLLFTALCRPGAGQDLYDKISKKMCQCLEEEKVVDSIGGAKCFKKIFLEFAERLVKYHKVNAIRDLDMDEYYDILSGRMSKSCKYMNDLYKDSVYAHNPKFEPDTKPVCDSLHIGEFYYTQINYETNLYDTIYASFTKDEYYERMLSTSTFSRLSIKWTSPCHFKLIFIESDDIYKNSFSKRGDVYEYEIRKATADSFIAELIWDRGPQYFVEFKRLK